MRITILIVLLAVSQVSCAQPEPDHTAHGVTYLDQGWDETTRQKFYFLPQGSHLIPVDWFLALVDVDGEPFATQEKLAKYGFIPAAKRHDLNPYELPIGFAVEETETKGVQLGLTCAACHTANISVRGRTIRIDGGQAALDLDGFYQSLARAVSHTRIDPPAFSTFSAKVLADGENDASRTALKKEFTEFEVLIRGDAEIRRPEVESGFGRVDALTQIVNALAVNNQNAPLNLRPIESPTSYPFLWFSSHLDFVQWNPIASSPIARNGGEVLGVFGDADLHSEDPQSRFKSSILIDELFRLEQWVGELEPPTWDTAIFGSIDQEKAETGEGLYRQHCNGCHSMRPFRMTDPSENYRGKTFIETTKVDYRKVGTDPSYVERLKTRHVITDIGSPSGERRVVPALQFFLGAVGPIVRRAMDDAGVSPDVREAMNGYRFRPSVDGKPPEVYRPKSFTDLKAGPLAGVWATGPYLHNGSVPSIYELLSPVSERRQVFWVGSQELDTTKLGFVSDGAPGRFRFDTSIPGNWNIGHVYPEHGLSSDERLALIEFIKTLR